MAQISRPRTGHDIHGRDDMTTGFGGNSTGNRGFNPLWFLLYRRIFARCSIPIWGLVYLCENLIINVPKVYIKTRQHYKIKLDTDTQGAREFLTFSSFPLLLFVYI